jgi:hypothetical protein
VKQTAPEEAESEAKEDVVEDDGIMEDAAVREDAGVGKEADQLA